MSKKRIWANTDWEVAEDGMATLSRPVEYFIPRNRLCELRSGMQARGIAMWPLHIAAKSEMAIEPFLEAYQQAIRLLQPKGLERIDLAESFALARGLRQR
jgi:hypothetical protein